MTFSTEREAKEYLIGRIVAEAQNEGVVLTDIERKMLYFSETGWTLPDMLEVNAQFDREYDNSEYEQKILGLALAVERRVEAVGGDDQAVWDQAVEKLSEGDHYLLVLINSRLAAGGAVKRRRTSDLDSNCMLNWIIASDGTLCSFLCETVKFPLLVI